MSGRNGEIPLMEQERTSKEEGFFPKFEMGGREEGNGGLPIGRSGEGDLCHGQEKGRWMINHI